MDFLNCLKMSTEAEAEVLRLRTSKDIPQNLPHLNTAQLSLSSLPLMTPRVKAGWLTDPPLRVRGSTPTRWGRVVEKRAYVVGRFSAGWLVGWSLGWLVAGCGWVAGGWVGDWSGCAAGDSCDCGCD